MSDVNVHENNSPTKEHNDTIDNMLEDDVSEKNNPSKESNTTIVSMVKNVVLDNKSPIEENITKAYNVMTLVDFISSCKLSTIARGVKWWLCRKRKAMQIPYPKVHIRGRVKKWLDVPILAPIQMDIL